MMNYEQGNNKEADDNTLPPRQDSQISFGRTELRSNRFKHLEKQHSELLAKSPSQLAQQAMSGSKIDMGVIQRIRTLSSNSRISDSTNPNN